VFSRSNIALIGMPGSGKSTIGVLLAKTLCMRFVDTDILIQNREGMSLIDIIRVKGTDYFSKAEETVIRDLHTEKTVIATGGSVVLLPEAMIRLRESSRIVYLEADLWKIRKRLWNFHTRGIVSEPGKTIEDLYRERLPLYRRYADIKIRLRGKKASQIVDEIVEKIFEENDSGD